MESPDQIIDDLEAQILATQKNLKIARLKKKLREVQAEEAEELKKLEAAEARLRIASATEPPSCLTTPIEPTSTDTNGIVDAFLDSCVSPNAEKGDVTNDQLETQALSRPTAKNHVQNPQPIKANPQPLQSAVERTSTPELQIQTAFDGDEPTTPTGPQRLEQATTETSARDSITKEQNSPSRSTKGNDLPAHEQQMPHPNDLAGGLCIKGTSTARPIQVAQNLQSPSNNAAPPRPNIPIYRGVSWEYLLKYLLKIETHIANYSTYFTDARKVELAVPYLEHAAQDRWHDHIKKHGSSWSSYRRFLAYQLSRNHDVATARAQISTAKQLQAQPVSHFALWLTQWEPHLSGLTNGGLMTFLHNGVLPAIRNRADRKPSGFLDFDSYVAYLQEVEKSIPSRSNITKRIPIEDDNLMSPISPAGDSYRPGDYSQQTLRRNSPPPASHDSPLAERTGGFPRRNSTAQPRLRSRSPSRRPRSASRESRGRSLGPIARAPPTGPRGDRGRSSSPLARGRRSSYEARDWAECTNLIGACKIHFEKNWKAYDNDFRKIDYGTGFLSYPLLQRWEHYQERLPRSNWVEFCIFLVKLLPPEGSADSQRDNYMNLKLRDGQSILVFALLAIRWSRSWHDPEHDMLRHLWDRLSGPIKSLAGRNYEHFKHFGDFVDFLCKVEGDRRLAKRAPSRPPKRPMNGPPIRSRSPPLRRPRRR